MADFLFGNHDPMLATHVLERLFVETGNRFSHEFATAALVGTNIAGLLLAHPGKLMKKLERPMLRHLFRIYGRNDMLHFLPRAMPLMMGHKEAERDEFYIFTLAVLPEFQRHGIGKRLMLHSETLAKEAGLTKLSLGVEVDNERALRLYYHEGFRTVEIVRARYLERHIGYPGYYRMVKMIG
ncbi:MAG: GNAT family N-acetyltransferase [Verrucomicrobia bacterium]|nr:GNAT family N-acetyltransferase [Verrucomicrobiota bacterium]